jgi:flagellar motility protein MotE (MotC chaperone)
MLFSAELTKVKNQIGELQQKETRLKAELKAVMEEREKILQEDRHYIGTFLD